MSLTKDILRIAALYHPIGNAALYEYLYGETIRGKKINTRSVEAIVNRLKREGFLRKTDKELSVTADGQGFLNKEVSSIRKFFKPENILDNREKPKKLIVIFDIPEKRKRYREWLREELVGLGFTLIQKSVWLGPGLPKEFVEYLNECGLLKHVRFFRATEQEIM
ncbi:MAG: hypothetical protein Q7R67_01215 [bacterium]|nr:hypothetical protein [bacterium]